MLAPLPEVFGDFLLIGRIAQSARAEVLLAVRLGDRSGRTHVLKRPALGERPSGPSAQGIAREAEVLAAVRAPTLVALEAAGEIAGLPYLAVEHVRGAPLDVLLARGGPLPAAAARAVAVDLARALAALHAAGWVHSDVAPSNVLVDDAGEARLIDLGAAARAGVRRTGITGKPGYAAPEAVRPVEAAAAEDVYAWGVVVAECALGRRLFDERDLAEAGSRGEPGRALSDVGDDEPEVRAALGRDPGARPSAEALAAALGARPLDRSTLAERVAAASGAAVVEPLAADRAGPEPSRRAGEVSAGAPPVARRGTPAAVPAALELAAPSGAAPLVVPADPPTSPLTPTAPMVVGRRTLPTDPPGRTAGVETTSRSAEPAPTPRRRASDRSPSRAGLVVIALAALVAGGIVGRASARFRGGSVSYAGAIPRRAEIKLDGRAVTAPADGSPFPVAPGRHTLVVQLPKGAAREYSFTVRPGEQVVLVPINRAGGAAPDAEDR